MSEINSKSSVFSLSQGTKFQDKKNSTLGSFSNLDGASKVPSTFSVLESFLPNELHTDADGNELDLSQNSAGADIDYQAYSTQTLDELYTIFKAKAADLKTKLEFFDSSPALARDTSTFGHIYTGTSDGSARYVDHSSGTMKTFSDSSITSDNLGDVDMVSDTIRLTCGNMATDSTRKTSYSDSGTIDTESSDVCNPFSSSVDQESFREIVVLIAQLNEIVEQMQSKFSDGESLTNVDGDNIDQTLADLQDKYASLLEKKQATTSSAYLEAERLKYDSSKLVYIMLVLGSLILGVVVFTRIIKASK
jgi:hypothetical protein